MNPFCGHPTAELSCGHLRLEYLTDVGPRIVRLFVPHSEVSLLAEVPDAVKTTQVGEYRFMGGHRLWHAPEALPRTYLPDEPVAVQLVPDGVRLSAPAERGSGIAKSIQIHSASEGEAVTITHELRNDNPWAVELAPWALTMFRMGGVAILPQARGNADPDGLIPNRHLVLWPYASVHDRRLSLADDFILLKGDAALPACKIGCDNPAGWNAYWLDGVLFVKRYRHEPGARYPDRGCSTEVYCGDKFLELESLGALSWIAPGEKVIHEERWELYDSLDQSFISPSLRQCIAAL
jgi:hypothetical protein